MPRITAYKQLENSDCGITCIRIIAKYYGKDVPLNILRTRCDVSRIGVSLNDIVDCAKSIGLKSIPVTVSKENIFRMPLPAILFWKQQHYVVLYKVNTKKNKFYLVDPAQGKIILSKDDFFSYWSGDNKQGISALFAPTQEFYKLRYSNIKSSKKGLLRLLESSVWRYKKGFLTVAFFTIISVVADVTLPMVFRQTIDEGIKNKDIGLVWLLVLGQLCIFIGNYIANNIIEIALTKLGLKISINLISEYLAKLIRLPISFFDRKVSSDLIQKIDDQNRIKNFLVNIPDLVFFTFLNVIVFSGLLIHYNFMIFLIVVLGMILSYGWVRLFVQKRREIDYSYYSYSSKNRNNVYELINGIHEIKINNAHQNRVDIWNATQKKINTLSLKSALLQMSINSGNTFFSRVKDISITGLCATLVIKNQMTIGTMMTISYIVGRLTLPISNLINSITTIQDASISYERLDEVINQI
jgi:ATP-binding cassette subfamily B protein